MRDNRHVRRNSAIDLLVLLLARLLLSLLLLSCLVSRHPPPPSLQHGALSIFVAHAHETRFYVVGFEDHEAVAVVAGESGEGYVEAGGFVGVFGGGGGGV